MCSAYTLLLSAYKGERMWVAMSLTGQLRCNPVVMHTSYQVLPLQVLESWRMVLRGDFYIKLESLRVHATQDTGYVTCVEVMNAENTKGRCDMTDCSNTLFH